MLCLAHLQIIYKCQPGPSIIIYPHVSVHNHGNTIFMHISDNPNPTFYGLSPHLTGIDWPISSFLFQFVDSLKIESEGNKNSIVWLLCLLCLYQQARGILFYDIS